MGVVRMAAVVVAAALMVPAAGAACPQWDLTGLAQLKRSDGTVYKLKELRQRRSDFQARASWSTSVATFVGSDRSKAR